jgi:hypothetical protein
LLLWTFLEVLRLAIEMGEIYRTANEIDEPPPAISESPGLRASSTAALSRWVVEHLIGVNHPVHQLVFDIGRAGAPFFSDWLDDSERDEFGQAHCEALAKSVRKLLVIIIGEAKRFDGGIRPTSAVGRFLFGLGINSTNEFDVLTVAIEAIPNMALLKALREDDGRALDEVVPPVLHTVGALSDLVVDWEGMKRSVKAIFDGGCQWPAVIISQNGGFGTGEVDKDFAHLLQPVREPDLKVFFVNGMAAAYMATKMTWHELQAQFANRGPSTDL